MIRKFYFIGIVLSVILLFGYNRDSVPEFSTQWWEDIEVQVQTRPARIDKGMIEFLVIATHPPRRPANNLIVSLSIDDTGHWRQAIQDGHLGVYRRALPVTDPQNNVLNVLIQRDNREGMLHFPLDQGRLNGS